MIIVNGLKPLTIITESSTFDVAAVLDPPLSPLWCHMLLLRKLASLYLRQSFLNGIPSSIVPSLNQRSSTPTTEMVYQMQICFTH